MRYQTNIPGDRRWNKTGRTKGRFAPLKNDVPGAIDWEGFFERCYACMEDGFLVVFASWRAWLEWSQVIAAKGFRLRTPVFWDKRCSNGGDLSDPLISTVEIVIQAVKGQPLAYPALNPEGVLRKRLVNCWHYGRVPKKEYAGHPTQKPLFVCEQLVRMFTAPGELVVDPFCGSGTSLVAAKQLGRKYFGCDIDEHFVQKSITRLKKTRREIE
jgi:site-specific DNA-methyltransferase (adenine-specific)